MGVVVRQVGRYVVLGSFGLAALGCAIQSEAVNRASREFSCPPEQIATVQRTDIANNVYDLNACGTMVRYSCISGENTPTQCTREPPPATWDIDPALVVSSPRPPALATDARMVAVCDRYALGACTPCLERAGESWRWHQCADGPGPTGGGY
jgi:hypothetical protein